VPQEFDWAAIGDLAPVPSATIPVVDAVAAQTTMTFSATLAASSVASAVLANPTDTSLKMVKRDDNLECAASDLPSADDTAANFEANTAFSEAATTAETPDGWTLAYCNANGSSQGVYGYMGYSVLSTYDPATCASSCDDIEGCSSINICKSL